MPRLNCWLDGDEGLALDRHGREARRAPPRSSIGLPAASRKLTRPSARRTSALRARRLSDDDALAFADR